MYGTYAAASMPITVTGIENLQIATAANANLDLSAYTKAANGVEKIIIDDASLISAKQITTGADQTLSLATGTTNTKTAGAVTWQTSNTAASASLVLNGYQGGKGVTADDLTIVGTLVKTQNIASTGAANKVAGLTLGAATDKVVITGDKALTVVTDLVSSGGATVLKTVDASAATGGVAITLAAKTNAAFAFTGGSGNDSVKFADDGLASLTSGAQLDGGAGTGDKIGILDTAISAAEYTAINAAKNFEVLGLNAAVAVDASKLTSIKEFSLDTSGDQTITAMKTGSIVTVAAAHTDQIVLAGDVGVNDVKVVIGSASTAGFAVGTATSDILTIGQNTVALVSNGDKTAANDIKELKVADNSTITITGDNALTISKISAATATGSKYDASGLTGKLTITANAATLDVTKALGDIIIGGSAGDVITTGVNGSTLTGNGGNDKFVVKATDYDTSVAASPMTKITDFTIGDQIEFTDATATKKIDLSSTLAGKTDAEIFALVVAAGTADGQVVWGNYNGFTYVFNETDGTQGVAGGTDAFVKLTGTLDLSTSTFATNVMTFA